MKILITGGSGLVGKTLTKKLIQKGYQVAWLSTKNYNNAPFPVYHWDIDKGIIEAKAIDEADIIIHLAGSNVSDKRWTPKVKRSTMDSRVKSAQLLYEKVKEQNKKLKAFISASGVNYYGTITSDVVFTETDAPGSDFLATVCKYWEAAANKFNDITIRTVIVRTGVVLSPDGGALKKMGMPVKYGLGAALGSGKQYMPWIHIDDLCNVYIKAIEDESIQGAYNAVAPEHQTNINFTKAIAKQLHKPFFLPNVPAFLLKIVLGEMAEIILKGSRISSEKLIKEGFTFKFNKLDEGLKDLLK